MRRTINAKTGEEIVIRLADKNDYELIVKMYDRFEPKESAQGLPPADPDRRRTWVCKILVDSLNVISTFGSEVIGHACLINIQAKVRAELEIAVHQDWQSRGIGSEMVSILIEAARGCGYQKIWLTVDATNRQAVHVYQKFGFEFVGPFDIEREMELQLK